MKVSDLPVTILGLPAVYLAKSGYYILQYLLHLCTIGTACTSSKFLQLIYNKSAPIIFSFLIFLPPRLRSFSPLFLMNGLRLCTNFQYISRVL